MPETDLKKEDIMVVLDSMPRSVRDAINYSTIGFTGIDIGRLYVLWYTKKKTTSEIVQMIKQKEAYLELMSPLRGINGYNPRNTGKVSRLP